MPDLQSWGCVALDNPEIDELDKVAGKGTRVEILPWAQIAAACVLNGSAGMTQVNIFGT